MAHHKRTRKFIDRTTQMLIGGQVVLHSLLLVGLLALFLFAEPFVTMFSNYSSEDHMAIAKELILLNSAKWPLFLLLLLFTGTASIIFSHQIVGPIYKVNQTLTKLSQRQLNLNVKFRKTDYFKPLEAQLNHVLERWKGDITIVKQTVEELKKNPGSQEKLAELENLINSYEGL